MFRLGHVEFPAVSVPDALYAIPCMGNPGVKEKPNDVYKGNLATFKEYRGKGGLIGFALDPRTGHECGDSRYLAIPFLDACMACGCRTRAARTRPSSRWTRASAGWRRCWAIRPCRRPSTKGDPKEAVWLPNEAVAKAWMEYVKTGAVGDTTPPPAPFDVKATAKGDRGTEITWSAEADFESGIGQFIVLRDGKELAKVPEKPVGRFGRPLFQGMTYHDTPDQPLREMRYLDASAKAGEKHAYAVITVNSVGLKSAPSAAATTSQGDMVLWYRQPAEKWLEAMPMGNGLMGAMVFGGTQKERIALNESSFWSGRPHDYDDPEAIKYFPQIRDLVFAGKFQEAEKMADAHFCGVPEAQQAYQPLGDLLLSFDGVEKIEDYRRELDMETGVAKITLSRRRRWRFTREVFRLLPGPRDGRPHHRRQARPRLGPSAVQEPLPGHGDRQAGQTGHGGMLERPDGQGLADRAGRGQGGAFQAALAATAEGGRSAGHRRQPPHQGGQRRHARSSPPPPAS